MGKNLAIKTIVAIGIGAAVFVILGRFASIPTGIPNTNINTSYAFLALMAVVFGPIAGGFIGLIGHALLDSIMWGSIWWSWVIISAFVGFFIGLTAKRINIESGEFGKKQIISFNIIQALVQIVGWGVLAPALDILIYAEPANKVWTQGIVAGLANIVTVAVLGTILLVAYAKTRVKSGSLKVE
ncbi:ECF-type riboflavin transporter substrate-binding protein [Bacillus sp. FJAT-49711]|uniref:ECF-type riboflavin transporter substrate-binding protein n=1 Tax=Bacillus sp. FJAT-49711 TaxID=2833585 RepID=UPI001BCA1402|nr:ECF-type riboflavin transporter substrate-binding protein [Bacillus sp. FJAT-49711]MBS4219179.1 ECF-type riboflavin transporter substrate-binding protein [Bacillus sp. FJAT-49711]